MSRGTCQQLWHCPCDGTVICTLTCISTHSFTSALSKRAPNKIYPCIMGVGQRNMLFTTSTCYPCIDKYTRSHFSRKSDLFSRKSDVLNIKIGKKGDFFLHKTDRMWPYLNTQHKHTFHAGHSLVKICFKATHQFQSQSIRDIFLILANPQFLNLPLPMSPAFWHATIYLGKSKKHP